MSTKSPRSFTREFKLDLCRQGQSGQKRPAQVCREHRSTEGLLLRWRREYEQRSEEAFSSKEPSATQPLEQKVADRAEGRRPGTLLRAALSGEHDPKKSSGQWSAQQRYVLITEARASHPEAPVRRLCQMFGVNRSWYLQQRLPASVSSLEDATALRDAIERLCLDFPGYGYRRVTAQLHRDGWTVNHKLDGQS